MPEVYNIIFLLFCCRLPFGMCWGNTFMCHFIFTVFVTQSRQYNVLGSLFFIVCALFCTEMATGLLVEGWPVLLPLYFLNIILSFSLHRQDFVDAYVDYIFNRSVASLYSAFHEGFHKVCGGKVLQLFQPSELQAMVIGNTNYDWKELEKVRTIVSFCFCIILISGCKSSWVSSWAVF